MPSARRTKEAEKLLTRMQADADALKVGRTKATVGALLERWMDQHQIDPTTRMTYESQIRMYIVPAVGDVPLVLFVRDASQRLEALYSRLRKCRALCNGKPFVEQHAEKGPHDCAAVGCKVHLCKPYAASSVRSIHAILSGACSAAVRWGWISFNPMPSVRPPAKPRPQPRPPTSEQMARIVEAAWASSAEWGLYVWLSAVLGARRGEVVALQWEDVDLAAGVVRLDENYVRTAGGMLLHALAPPAGVVLPELRPFGNSNDALPVYEGLPPADAQFLRQRFEWGRETFPHLNFALPVGPVHGDANVGNVICDDHGRAVLIDLDSFAVGAREWDLIQTALFADRLGWHSKDEYCAFVDVYGYDVTQWIGYTDLADMREIAMTSWMARKASTSRDAAAESVKRVEAMRTGASRRDWGAH